MIGLPGHENVFSPPRLAHVKRYLPRYRYVNEPSATTVGLAEAFFAGPLHLHRPNALCSWRVTFKSLTSGGSKARRSSRFSGQGRPGHPFEVGDGALPRLLRDRRAQPHRLRHRCRTHRPRNQGRDVPGRLTRSVKEVDRLACDPAAEPARQGSSMEQVPDGRL